MLGLIIETINNNAEVDTAVEAVINIFNQKFSQNSPFQVDISNLFQDGVMDDAEKRFLDIKEIVTQTTQYKNIIDNIFNDTSGFSVEYAVVDNLTNGAGKRLNGATSLNGTIATIEIDRNHINTATKIDIALTIMHEALHAYMYYIIANDVNVSVPNNVNLNDISECLDLYLANYVGMSGGQSAQHQFMAEELLPILQDVILEALPLLYDQGILNLIKQQGRVRIINENGELEWKSGPLPGNIQNYYWNWSDSAYYFALGGLQDTDFFQSTIAIIPAGINFYDVPEENIRSLAQFWLYYSYYLKNVSNYTWGGPNFFQIMH